MESGERWSSVYSQLDAQGLAVAGGRVSKVGDAGLIIGGTSHLPSTTLVVLYLLTRYSRWILLLFCHSRLRM